MLKCENNDKQSLPTSVDVFSLRNSTLYMFYSVLLYRSELYQNTCVIHDVDSHITKYTHFDRSAEVS